MSFSGGMGSWTPVDMPPPSSAPVVNQTLKRADEVEIKKWWSELTFKVNIFNFTSPGDGQLRKGEGQGKGE